MARLVAVVVVLAACGGDDVPDSGYGSSQSVPITRACAPFCDRIADCTVRLCNENSMSSQYDDLRTLLEIDCNMSCDDATVMSEVSAAQWTCLFTDSCRMVFEDDSCNADGTYSCD